MHFKQGRRDVRPPDGVVAQRFDVNGFPSHGFLFVPRQKTLIPGCAAIYSVIPKLPKGGNGGKNAPEPPSAMPSFSVALRGNPAVVAVQ